MKTISSLSKGMEVLMSFTMENSEWGVRELANHLGYPRSTVQMLLKTLKDTGLLIQTPNRRYRLGWGVFELAGVFLAQLELRKVALPVMKKLADAIGEIVHLGVLDDGQVIYVEKVEGSKSIPLITRLGLRYPAYCTAVGKVLLAHVREEQTMKLDLVPMTPETIVDIRTLQEELAQIRSKGIAYDREEAVSGLTCIAVPIRDFTGEVIAGISISAPTIRFKQREKQWTEMIIKASKEISSEMGFFRKAAGYRKNG
ncbi:IclR family transcriptional regulator [Parageobacillus thermoglucosidasius]|uniref:IclR family transcriptional regulator n=1 Tax=Parageobacillus thermoglucosidasius TaxID=1426 RepID=UPI001F18FB7B|nr:IclR family transcriptional regulator [Parageobacillus thermoglucosidasius]